MNNSISRLSHSTELFVAAFPSVGQASFPSHKHFGIGVLACTTLIPLYPIVHLALFICELFEEFLRFFFGYIKLTSESSCARSVHRLKYARFHHFAVHRSSSTFLDSLIE